MTNYNTHLHHYRMFMITFKRLYPELYAKYKHAILLPVAGVGKITLDNKILAASASRIIITNIITEYYTALNN